MSTEEQTYLQWFLNGTATYSPRFFASPFWWPTIIQATVDTPRILKALLALSAAQQHNALYPANQASEGNAPDDQEIFMMKQYNGAIKDLREHLDIERVSNHWHFLVAVITIELFLLLERTRRNFFAVHVHLKSGVQLTRQLIEVPAPSEPVCFSGVMQCFNLAEEQG